MVLVKRILFFSLICMLIAAIAIGMIFLLGNHPGAVTNKGVFV